MCLSANTFVRRTVRFTCANGLATSMRTSESWQVKFCVLLRYLMIGWYCCSVFSIFFSFSLIHYSNLATASCLYHCSMIYNLLTASWPTSFLSGEEIITIFGSQGGDAGSISSHGGGATGGHETGNSVYLDIVSFGYRIDRISRCLEKLWEAIVGEWQPWPFEFCPSILVVLS